MREQISPDIKEAIRKLAAEGMKIRHIQSKIKEIFGTEVNKSTMYYIIDPAKRTGAKKKSGNGRKKGRRKGTAGETPGEIVKDIRARITELEETYVTVLKQIRGDLIAAIAKLRKQ